MSFTPTNPVNPFPVRGASEPAFARTGPIVTVQELKDTYLFGLPLRSKLTNTEMKEESIKTHILNAISEVEIQTKIFVSLITITDERHDYNVADYNQYNYIQLNYHPICQIKEVRAKFPNSIDFLQYPTEWVSCYNEFGLLQLTPTNGAITQFFITQDASYIPLLLGSRSRWPQLWAISYTAGFPNDKIPFAINKLIAITAALSILSIIGPVSAPYQSYGIGLDGASQSVGLAGPQWLAGLINDYKEQQTALTDAIKRQFCQSLRISSL